MIEYKCNQGKDNPNKTRKREKIMTLAQKMKEITNKVIKEKEEKEAQRIDELYNSFLVKVEREALNGKSSIVIENQGFDNERIIDKFVADGFTVTKTKMNDNYIKW